MTNLIFYDKVTQLVDEGKAVDIVYLDFSKVFDAVFHNIFLEKVQFMAWTYAFFAEQKTGWMARPRKWTKSSWRLLTGGVLQASA